MLFDTIFQVLPKGDPQLSACFLKDSKGITETLSSIRSIASADFAPYDVFSGIAFTQVIVQSNVGAL